MEEEVPEESAMLSKVRVVEKDLSRLVGQCCCCDPRGAVETLNLTEERQFHWIGRVLCLSVAFVRCSVSSAGLLREGADWQFD